MNVGEANRVRACLDCGAPGALLWRTTKGENPGGQLAGHQAVRDGLTDGSDAEKRIRGETAWVVYCGDLTPKPSRETFVAAYLEVVNKEETDRVACEKALAAEKWRKAAAREMYDLAVRAAGFLLATHNCDEVSVTVSASRSFGSERNAPLDLVQIQINDPYAYRTEYCTVSAAVWADILNEQSKRLLAEREQE